MEQISLAAERVGRDCSGIQAIVVTKNRSIEEIQQMIDLGFRHFAENRVDKLLERQQAFPQDDIVWHLIGPLQRRKVRKIVNQIDYFHALDRLSILEEMDKHLEHCLSCFVEVNVSGEESKHGFTPEECVKQFNEMRSYSSLNIVGLMTMAPFSASKTEILGYFQALRDLARKLEVEYQLQAPLQLSMGMSQDFQEAILAGATHLRIGTAWFEEGGI